MKTRRMTAEAGPYAGLDRFEARKRIVADLEKQGLAGKDRAVHACDRQVRALRRPSWSRWSPRSGSCERSRWLKKRWPRWKKAASSSFRRTGTRRSSTGWTTFATGASRGSSGGGIAFPRGTARDCGKITVAREAPEVCSHCGSPRIEQDPDVLDTWFSSGLWPFSTLGWPERDQGSSRLTIRLRC